MFVLNFTAGVKVHVARYVNKLARAKQVFRYVVLFRWKMMKSDFFSLITRNLKN